MALVINELVKEYIGEEISDNKKILNLLQNTINEENNEYYTFADVGRPSHEIITCYFCKKEGYAYKFKIVINRACKVYALQKNYDYHQICDNCYDLDKGQVKTYSKRIKKNYTNILLQLIIKQNDLLLRDKFNIIEKRQRHHGCYVQNTFLNEKNEKEEILNEIIEKANDCF